MTMTTEKDRHDSCSVPPVSEGAAGDRLTVELIKYAGAWSARRVDGMDGEIFFIRKSSLRDKNEWATLREQRRLSLAIKRAAGRGIVSDAFLL